MHNEAHNPKAVLGIFYAFTSLFGLIFILLIPSATKPGPASQGWWTQPALMPRLSLWLIALSATYLFGQHLLKLRQRPDLGPSSHSLRAELFQWLRPLEFFMYYLIYIWLLGLVGYFLSSLIFIVTLCLRVGLRSPKWMVISCLTAIALVAMFRWSLQVWIPPAALYDLFPKEARIFLMRNF